RKPVREMSQYAGYIPQESILIPELTVEDNLKLWAGFGDYRENKKNLAGLCVQFQVQGVLKEKVKNLSGGMNKRVNIVCALIHNPSLLLMDEPSAALDLVFKEELKGYIKDFTSKGGNVLICSHDVGEIAECESLWAIRNGEAFEVPEKMTMTEIIAEYMK
ncbi:MAG: ATP-binding cassette domain-containing protein, partial [Lachnospiraceae bacterium]|nr:ATP-binding cassette domain-containing protein [Lachnospiraceae bacterium]